MQPVPPRTALNRNLIILNFTVVIWSFTGILGKLISVDAVSLVWYRVLIGFITLFIYFKLNHTNFKVTRKEFLQLFFTGALVGTHWILFFLSIKLSTVSVALVCYSSLTLFTAIFDPLINKKRIAGLEIIFGLLIIGGILVIFKFEPQYTKGIISGLLCAMLASIFYILNSRQVKILQPTVISFYELFGAFFWISVYLFSNGGFDHFKLPGKADIGYLLLLGTVCTSLAYVAGVSVMRSISAFRVALFTNLEPVYGIILSFVFFGDMNKMTIGFWVGATIILSAILLFPVVQKQLYKKN